MRKFWQIYQAFQGLVPEPARQNFGRFTNIFTFEIELTDWFWNQSVKRMTDWFWNQSVKMTDWFWNQSDNRWVEGLKG